MSSLRLALLSVWNLECPHNASILIASQKELNHICIATKTIVYSAKQGKHIICPHKSTSFTKLDLAGGNQNFKLSSFSSSIGTWQNHLLPLETSVIWLLKQAVCASVRLADHHIMSSRSMSTSCFSWAFQTLMKCAVPRKRILWSFSSN